MWADMHPAQCYGCRYRETGGDSSVGYQEFPICEKMDYEMFMDDIIGDHGSDGINDETVHDDVFYLVHVTVKHLMARFETLAFGLASINNCPFFEKPVRKTIYDRTRHLFEEDER